MAERERRIQEIAYLLWEGEGRPDGQADRFWHMAEAAYGAEVELTGGDKDETPASLLADVADAEGSLAQASTPVFDAASFEVEAQAKKQAAKPKVAAADEGKGEPNGKVAKAKAGKASAEAPIAAKAVEAEPAPKSGGKPKAKKSR